MILTIDTDKPTKDAGKMMSELNYFFTNYPMYCTGADTFLSMAYFARIAKENGAGVAGAKADFLAQYASTYATQDDHKESKKIQTHFAKLANKQLIIKIIKADRYASIANCEFFNSKGVQMDVVDFKDSASNECSFCLIDGDEKIFVSAKTTATPAAACNERVLSHAFAPKYSKDIHTNEFVTDSPELEISLEFSDVCDLKSLKMGACYPTHAIKGVQITNSFGKKLANYTFKDPNALEEIKLGCGCDEKATLIQEGVAKEGKKADKKAKKSAAKNAAKTSKKD